MKFKENWKRFWTLDRHHAEGFTLVELIVVIAILAILAGVAVPAYSGYVKKANMAADQSLVSDIRYAAVLAIMNDYAHEFSDTVTVKLSSTDEAIIDGNEADTALLTKAMVSAFGENWAEVCMLKYDGWTTDANTVIEYYEESSYNNHEDSLLAKVNDLSGALTGFFSTGKNVPPAITSILEAQGVDTSNPTALANGAVSALAASISGADDEVRAKITTALTDNTSYGTVEEKSFALQAAYGEIYDDGNMVTLATAATLYAYAEAYSQFASDSGYDVPANLLNGIAYTYPENPDQYLPSTQILGNIVNAFQKIQDDAMSDGADVAIAYNTADSASKDANAFLAVMDALDDSSDVLNKNLTSSTFFADGSAANLLKAYINVGNQIGDAKAAVMVLPDKNVYAYLGGLIE